MVRKKRPRAETAFCVHRQCAQLYARLMAD